MLCPHCRSEIPVASAACPSCHTAILVGGSPLSPAPVEPKQPPLALRLLAVFGGVFCFALVALLGVGAARKAYPRMNAEALGYAFGTCIGAFLLSGVVLLIYLKVGKKKHNPAYLFGATCAFALLWAVLGIAPQIGKREPSQEEINAKIARLAREGLGQAPVSRDEDELDGLLRSFFADVKKFNEDYNAEIAAIDNSSLQSLYSAGSFDSEANISLMLDQLHVTLALDEKYASLRPLIQKLKTRLDASSLSESSKRNFWKGFNDSIESGMQPRDAVMAKEHAWLSDSIGLYEFMRDSRKSFHVKGKQILFDSDDLVAAYNQKIEKVQSERKEFLEIKEQFAKSQQEKLGKLGLKQSDFGQGHN